MKMKSCDRRVEKSKDVLAHLRVFTTLKQRAILMMLLPDLVPTSNMVVVAVGKDGDVLVHSVSKISRFKVRTLVRMLDGIVKE